MQLEHLTPAMKQYVQMKQQNPDCILFFRIGDFYEVFFEDAKICASVLDLVITSKNKNAENPIPMAGIPHHSVEKYIPRLIAKGYKVAIAEQTTDPVPWKIVERTIKSIITPGTTIYEQQKQASYLLAITTNNEKSGSNYHIAWGDFTLGEYLTKSFNELGRLQKFILQLQPTEIIIDTDSTIKDELISPIQQYLQCLVSVYAVPADPEHFLTTICKVQQISSFGKAVENWRLQAITLLFAYLQHTQKQQLTNVSKIRFHSSEGLVLMDEVTIKNLELFASSYESSTKYSLFWILDTTKTAGGSRLLYQLLANPINIKSELNRRLSKIEYFLEHKMTSGIHQFLGSFFDIPKILSLILYRKLNRVPFMKLRSVLKNSLFGFEKNILDELKKLQLWEEDIKKSLQIFELLERALKPDDVLLGEQDYIAEGFDPAIDELRKIAYHSDEILLQYQKELVKVSWISNIKLKFVMNQGYFLELTNKDSELFETFLSQQNLQNLAPEQQEKFAIVRRQTLKGNQRYTSPYLDSLQSHILGAKESLKAKELEVLVQLQTNISHNIASLYNLAEKLARLDVFTSQALFAREHRLSKPELSENALIEIQGGRHPVIEAFLPKDQPFIPNNLAIWEDKTHHQGLIHIITWPNMWGKSTFLRQSALIVLLAHCGLFVPAQQTKIWLVDGIFARVGSGDIIAKNQSTFMTEMIEVANILNNATKKSFIIFDELWRGTSTYDGLALTKAILHYILSNLKAKTLIATHYHELIALEQESNAIKNFSVSVYETDKEVVFMKKITAGGANKSYGIDVAKLAGIPNPILEEARLFLKLLEKNQKSDLSNQPSSQGLFSVQQEDFTHKAQYEKIKGILAGMDLNGVTPLQALQILMKIKEEL